MANLFTCLVYTNTVVQSARTWGHKDRVGQRGAWGDTMKQDTETNCNVTEELLDHKRQMVDLQKWGGFAEWIQGFN